MGMMFLYKATTTSSMDQVVPWCEQQLGKFNQDWYRLGRDPAADLMQPYGPDIYYFDNKKYHMWFTLRWS
jgi:hypothetical protein